MTGVATLDAKIEPEPMSGCWLWIGARKPKGYGNINIAGRFMQAHRVVYETVNGPIPEGQTLDHRCRLTCCVNPGHLRPMTMRDNNRAGRGWAGRHAQQTHCKRGHPFDVGNTIAINNGRSQGGRECRACRQGRERRRVR